jgi:hypothetical protein
MQIYATFGNQKMEAALARAMENMGREIKYVSAPDEADVLLLVTKGKDFGHSDIDILGLQESQKKKVLVTDGNGAADEVVRPVLEGGRLKIRMSDIAAAVARLAPPEFVIEDDAGAFEIVEDDGKSNRWSEDSCSALPLIEKDSADEGALPPGAPDAFPPEERPGATSLKERLAAVIKKDRAAASKKPCNTCPPVTRTNENHAGLPAVESFLTQAVHTCVFVGVKGGVGVSTLVAALNEIFKDYGSLHLEVGSTPSG